ncbi:MAG: hypothetical protein JNK93_07035 [Planctomycetia bacterium]|nr:hypothetical protein [Planctomycetia bacterium]
MLRLLVPCLALALAGCSSSDPLSMATTAEKSRPALDAALGGWKAGKTEAELKGQSPPVYLIDADFKRGAKLVDYKVEGDGKPHGTGFRYDVSLTIDGGKGAKKVAYRVVTEPNTAISREDD